MAQVKIYWAVFQGAGQAGQHAGGSATNLGSRLAAAAGRNPGTSEPLQPKLSQSAMAANSGNMPGVHPSKLAPTAGTILL